MKHNTRKLALLVGLATMLLAPVAFAQGGPGAGRGLRGHGPGGHRGLRAAEALGLTPDQQQRMRALRAEHREAMEPIRQDMQALRQEMRQAWAAENPDRARILAIGQRMDALRAAQRDLRAEHRAEARAILTPEQQALLAERRAQRGERGDRGRRGLRGRGFGGGPGMGLGPRGRHGGPGAGMGRGARLVERLNLDDSQRAQIQALRQEMRQDLEPNRAQMRALRQQMRALRSSANPDPEAIASLEAQMQAQRAAIRERRVDFRLEVHSILTPEQRAQLAELQSLRGQRGHRGRRGLGAPAE